MINRGQIKQMDWGLFAVTGILLVVGMAVLFSATTGWEPGYLHRQMISLTLSVPFALFLAWVNPQVWERHSRWVYLMNLTLLVLVLLIGPERKGAQRWIILPGGFQLQPSEFAKLFIILTLGSLLARMGDEIKTPRGYLIALMHLGIPMLLVFKQPDLGTSIVLGVMGMGMIYLAGARARHLLLTLLLTVFGFLAIWQFGILKDYQKARLESFIRPEADARQTGYHILQSRYAIGSGQVFGKGYLQGTQKKLRYIPEQHTDFIFSVVGEEGGFVGATLLLALYAVFLTCIWRVMIGAREAFFRYVAGGVLIFFSFHIVTNIGMTMGLFPVVGIPLPFLSYGGTMLIVMNACIGLLFGIRMREEGLRF